MRVKYARECVSMWGRYTAYETYENPFSFEHRTREWVRWWWLVEVDRLSPEEACRRMGLNVRLTPLASLVLTV